jgi:hypothetical protein
MRPPARRPAAKSDPPFGRSEGCPTEDLSGVDRGVTGEITELEQTIDTVSSSAAPKLLNQVGVGADVAPTQLGRTKAQLGGID